ncbi:MAG: hypothetical protein JNM29_02865 [Candidatus Odyssella sp.]|nr:hypothetical protein [Candidatus Odyssella sp.]
MTSNATDAAELGFASPRHLPFVIGAAADLLLGLDLLVAGDLMAAWLAPGIQTVLGLPTATVLNIVGAGLLVVAVATLAFTWLDASRKTLWSVVLLNEAWVIGSAILVAVAHELLSGFGNAIVLGVAIVLAGLTFFQFRNIRTTQA